MAIRVGRCFYDRSGRVDPQYPGYTTVVVLTKGTNRWGMIGPYELKDEEGHIMENVWQFSKVYPRVEASKQRKSRFESVVVWDHPAEQHLLDPGQPAAPANCTPEYWAWRLKGFEAPYAVRYPPGYGKMDRCVGCLVGTEAGGYQGPLGYVESRKALYLPLYARLARQSPLFGELRRRFARGEKLLIAEVDGPHQESLRHYVGTYGLPADFIDRHSVAADAQSLRILLNDPLHPFGHGYCLAAAILDIDGELLGEEPPAEGAAEENAAASDEHREAGVVPDDDPLWADLGL